MRTVVMLLAIGMCGGCAQQAESITAGVAATDSDETNIRRWVDEWKAKTDSGDLAGARALVADDAVFLVPGFGRMDPGLYIEGASGSPEKLDLYEFSGGSEIEEIRVAGSLAYVLSKADFSIVVKESGEKTSYRGHSLSILEKSPSGQWLLIRDANTVLPKSGE